MERVSVDVLLETMSWRKREPLGQQPQPGMSSCLFFRFGVSFCFSLLPGFMGKELNKTSHQIPGRDPSESGRNFPVNIYTHLGHLSV